MGRLAPRGRVATTSLGTPAIASHRGVRRTYWTPASGQFHPDGAGTVAAMDDRSVPVSPPYLRTARSPRMIALLVLLLAVAAVTARLGMWQLDRAQIRGEAREAERVAELAADAVPLADVLGPQESFRGELVGQRVTVEGRFDTETLLVPGRALDGDVGYLALTGLTTDDGAVLAVVRGWVPEPVAPDPPVGDVRLSGYLQAGEAAGEEPAPGQVTAVSPAQLVNTWGGPIYTGYLVLAEVVPPQPSEVRLLPVPTLQGTGLNVQNLAYALQWWIFGVFAVLLWVRVVRDAARDAVSEPVADGGAP